MKIRLSKSTPPAAAFTPSSIVDSDSSKVPPPRIEVEDVAIALNLLVETVGDGGGSRLLDDTGYIEASNETSVLGNLARGW